MNTTTVRVGFLGCGNVGGPLVELIHEQHDAIAARTGIDLQITAIAVRDASRDRGLPVAQEIFTEDSAAMVASPDVDVVVEVVGGVDPLLQLLLDAMGNGKSVVTANKELMAAHGAQLYAAAADAGVDILFEAAVAAAIPLIRPLRESMAGEHLTRVMGIVNGTTNYILSQMTEVGASYDDALAEAQELGYAEPDPTADVEGYDARSKAAIIATIAFGAVVQVDDVYCEGISGITAADIALAGRMGHVIKLLAIAQRVEEGEGTQLAVKVYPAMLPSSHPLATVRGSFNAVFVEGSAMGEAMFYGRGAGGRPTASALLGDLIDAAGNHIRGAATPVGTLSAATIVPIANHQSAFYLNIEVTDAPGVLAAVAGVFGKHAVSIRSMEQEGLGDEARLIFITHAAREQDVDLTLAELAEMDSVRQVGAKIRVVGES